MLPYAYKTHQNLYDMYMHIVYVQLIHISLLQSIDNCVFFEIASHSATWRWRTVWTCSQTFAAVVNTRASAASVAAVRWAFWGCLPAESREPCLRYCCTFIVTWMVGGDAGDGGDGGYPLALASPVKFSNSDRWCLFAVYFLQAMLSCWCFVGNSLEDPRGRSSC